MTDSTSTWITSSDLADAADATILLLGAPLDALTLVHHAERMATAEPKRWVSYDMPIRQLVKHARAWIEERFGAGPA